MTEKGGGGGEFGVKSFVRKNPRFFTVADNIVFDVQNDKIKCPVAKIQIAKLIPEDIQNRGCSIRNIWATKTTNFKNGWIGLVKCTSHECFNTHFFTPSHNPKNATGTPKLYFAISHADSHQTSISNKALRRSNDRVTLFYSREKSWVRDFVLSQEKLIREANEQYAQSYNIWLERFVECLEKIKRDVEEKDVFDMINKMFFQKLVSGGKETHRFYEKKHILEKFLNGKHDTSKLYLSRLIMMYPVPDIKKDVKFPRILETDQTNKFGGIHTHTTKKEFEIEIFETLGKKVWEILHKLQELDKQCIGKEIMFKLTKHTLPNQQKYQVKGYGYVSVTIEFEIEIGGLK
jgi:hypothetical protein